MFRVRLARGHQPSARPAGGDGANVRLSQVRTQRRSGGQGEMNLTGDRTMPTRGCLRSPKRLPLALQDRRSPRRAGEEGFTAAGKPLGLDDCLIATVGLDRRHSLKVRTTAQLCAPGRPSDQDVTYRTDGGSDNGNSGNRTLDQRRYAVEMSSTERSGLRARGSAVERDRPGRCGAVTW